MSVHGLLVQDGQVLLSRIAPGHLSEASWTLPGGGIGWGETFKESLLREFVRVTSVDINQGALAYESNSRGQLSKSGRNHHIVFWVTAQLGQSPVAETNGSTDKVEWIDLEAIRTLPLSPLVELALSHLQSQA
jgi:8-oxo-dGTP diphosphatase